MKLFKKLREAEAKATPGPWTSHDNHGTIYVSNGKDGTFAKFDNRICEAVLNLHHPPHKENMDLIALSRNQLKDVLQALDFAVGALQDVSSRLDWQGTASIEVENALEQIKKLGGEE